MDVQRVIYLHISAWPEILFQFRYWLAAIIWIMFTMGFAQLYRRTVRKRIV